MQVFYRALLNENPQCLKEMQLLNDNIKPITPKKTKESHRAVSYTLQYVPRLNKVMWLLPWTINGHTIHFHDYNATFTHARRAVRKKIDTLKDGKPL